MHEWFQCTIQLSGAFALSYFLLCFQRGWTFFMMDDSGDSAKDLFIAQSNFRVDTQEAEEAANFFQGLNYDPAAPERVEYFDFLNDDTTGYTVCTESQSQAAKTAKAEGTTNPTVSLQNDDNDNKVYLSTFSFLIYFCLLCFMCHITCYTALTIIFHFVDLR